MHILTIPSWYPYPKSPTAGIFFKEQAEAIQATGVRVGTIAPLRRSLRTLSINSRAPEFSLNWEVPTYTRTYFAIPRAVFFNDWRHIRIGLDLYSRYVRNHGTPDLIHAHSALQGGELALNLFERFGIPYILTEHSSLFSTGLLTHSELSRVATIFNKSRALVSVSPSLAHNIEKLLEDTRGRWELIPNSVNDKVFNSPPFLGPKANSFNFLTIAYLKKDKNIDLVIRALAKLSVSKQVRLQIGGSGDELATLKSLTVALGVESKVEFLGHLSRQKVLKAMQECDAFILPSRHETFGVVLVEAMAVGKPVIATACGGPESIVTKEVGILVPVEDVDRLTQAMETLVENENLFNKETIRKSCIQRFGSETIANRTVDLYRRVIG